MRYLGLACDYDGTIAHHGIVDERTLAALERVRASGRKLLLVTGRQLDDLLTVFPRADLFDRVVAENGGLLYRPAGREQKILGEAPPDAFVERLRERGVAPLSLGRVVVATWEPHEVAVLETIRDLGLELQVVFNKGAVMVLPAGVNKGTGLHVALTELDLSPHNVVGVGDAENDHAFLRLCECAVAVSNALPMVKERADLVTRGDHGEGVIELIDRLVTHDLREEEPRITRHDILFGSDDDGEVRLKPYGGSILVAGPSGSGKSTAAIGILERLAGSAYQFCLIDPEGDYEEVAGAVVLGDSQRPPSLGEIIQLLRHPDKHALVKLYGMPLADRPAFFSGLLPRLQELRAETGRPHWVMVDEAHHLLPSTWDPASLIVPQTLHGMLFVTVHPESIAPAALSSVDVLVAIGGTPGETYRSFARASGIHVPSVPDDELPPGEALVWFRHGERGPVRLRPAMASIERRRHKRKYAEGELAEELSFYFRGPDARLNLRAQNLMIFLQIADGVDDATWLHHLRQGDYSRWLITLKDARVAAEVAHIESSPSLSPADSRALIRQAIEKHYTGPA